MSEKLQRSMSLTGCVAMIIGMVIGASIFVLVPALAGMTGPSLFLAYTISVVPAIFTGLYLMQLGGALPVTGANYFAVTRWLSPTAGFTVSLAAVVAMISTNCLIAWGFAKYIASYFPAFSITGCAIVIIIIFGFVNWIGVRMFVWIQALMLLLLLLAMIVFGIGGLFHINPEYTQPLFPQGIGKFIMVIAIATFSWAGFIAITEVAGEVKNPKRNIPVAIIISLVLVLFFYILQTYVFTGTLLWSEAPKIGDTAFLAAARTFLPEWVVAFIAFAALLAMATTINSIMFMAAREMYAWSRDHVIPTVFNRINRRFYTPEMAILLMTVLSVISIIFAAGLEKYALMVVFALMVIQSFGATAVWKMPKRASDIYEKALFKFSPFWRWFTWIGCLVCFTLIFLFGMLADLKTGLIFIGILAVGLIYWFWRKSHLRKRGIDLAETLSEMSDEVISELEAT